jgi:hypothetical protein
VAGAYRARVVQSSHLTLIARLGEQLARRGMHHQHALLLRYWHRLMLGEQAGASEWSEHDVLRCAEKLGLKPPT